MTGSAHEAEPACALVVLIGLVGGPDDKDCNDESWDAQRNVPLADAEVKVGQAGCGLGRLGDGNEWGDNGELGAHVLSQVSQNNSQAVNSSLVSVNN